MDSSRRWGRPSFAGTTMGDGSTTAYDATLMGPADQTYMTQDDDIDLGQRKPTVPSAQQKAPLKPALKSAMKKPTTVSTKTAASTSRPGQATKTATSAGASASAAPPKPKITAAERKKREAAAEQVIELLPLDYRGGSNPSAKRLAMSVILALIAAGQKGIRINEIVRAPDLPQAKVNKCLIALVGAKQVLRRSDNGVVYHLDPEKNPIAA